MSDWITVTQGRIDAFTETTGDHRGIRVDADCTTATRLDSTPPRDYLTLPMVTALLAHVVDLDAYTTSTNLEIDHLRFTVPVPVGSRIRMRVALDDLQITADTGLMRLTLTFEVEHRAEPACIARALYRLVAGTP